MRLPVVLVLLTGLLQTPIAAVAQEVAGRILIAVGDVTVLRGAQRIPAQTGAQIRTGDSVQLGAQSNAQLRFTDDSVVALRPETTFRITEYAFQDREPAIQRAFFNLVRGGMRTVTGAIGRVQRSNYGVVTPTLSLGIRGTNYTLVECDNNCRNPDGSLAPNGGYGAVTDGRIGITNETGEREFGADQYFYVASATTAPIQLIAPPSFVRDALDSRVRTQERQEKERQARAREVQQGRAASASSGAGTESAAAVSSGDSRVSSDVTSASLSAGGALTTNVYQVTTDASVHGPASVLQPTGTGTVFFRLDNSAGPVVLPVTCTSPPCGSMNVGEIVLGVNFTAQRAYVQTSFIDATTGSRGGALNLLTPVSSTSGGMPITVSGGQITFSGTYNLSNFPNQTAGFRCQTCGPNGTLGYVTNFSVSGVISGGQATLTLSHQGTSAGDTGGSLTATLTQQTPPNGLAAAIAIPNQTGGASSSGGFGWLVTVDSTGRLTQFGPTFGFRKGSVGSATNTIAGSAPTAGNLVWGAWTGAGANVTDFNYASYVTTAGAFLPWITGNATNTLPPGLGSSVTYTPVGSFVNSGTGVLNSASLTANFVNTTLAVSLNVTNPGAGSTFQMNGTSGFQVANGRFGAGFDSVTCAGKCSTGTPTGAYSGFFAGPNAEGVGLAFNAGYGATTGGVIGVAAFKR